MVPVHRANSENVGEANADSNIYGVDLNTH